MPLTDRFVLAGIGGALLLAGAAGWILLAPGAAAPGPSPEPASVLTSDLPSGSEGGASPSADATLVVDIEGGVAEPGIQRVPAGSRVADAIVAAGGFSPDADVPLASRQLNLAARLASRQADHASSRALADESIALARELGDPELIAYTLRGAGAVYHSLGQMDVSTRMYDEALALLERSADRQAAVEVRNQIGMIANEQGDFTTAVDILRECVAFSRSSGDLPRMGRHLESLANAQLGLGDIEGAASSWTESLAILRELNDRFGIIWSVGGLALVAAARKDDERALRLAAVVDRLSRESSLSTWSFRVKELNDMSERIRKKLGPKKSEAVWNEGQTMNVARALEYALGASPQAESAATEAGPLSRREREVAAMVAGGLTNREIAQRLFIAERTAEGHVERIRNKLGMRSRTEVATWAVAHGLGPRQP